MTATQTAQSADRGLVTETVAVLGAGGTMGLRGLSLPLIEAIAARFAEGAREHGDEDFSATYLTSTPRRD